MVEKRGFTQVTIRDVPFRDAQTLSRLRGTFMLKSSEVFSLGMQLLELELNMQVGYADDKVTGVVQLIQQRKQQIIDRYELAHELDQLVRDERGETARPS
jgi:hypothetical protein